MTKQNYFSSKVKSETTEKLIHKISSDNGLSEKYTLAALWELEARSSLPKEFSDTLSLLESKHFSEAEQNQYNQHVVPPDLPASIKYAAYLLYLGFAIDMMVFIVFDTMHSYSLNGLELPYSAISLITGVVIHMGKFWARLLYFAVFSFITFLNLVVFSLSAFSDVVVIIVYQILLLGALLLLVKKDSNNWYKKKTAPNKRI